MADSSYMEKMGRELKCPICLSLLNSAVSLTCNHVFCNSCISKSMKTASTCPVCKVPYRPREVRAAPHMDNLVSIYKSMETEMGLNIFVTKPSPTTSSEGGGSTTPPGLKINRTSPGKSKKRKVVHEACGSEKMDKTKTGMSDSQTMGKSSFSANKRVQVPLNSLSETPKQSEKSSKFEREASNTAVKDCENDISISLGEKADFNKNHHPVFCPFFWLKEVNETDEFEENPSGQMTEGNRVADTPRIIPSFSDIKDSDDDVPSKDLPSIPYSKSGTVDIYDSEMFEWTQRPCSPELCSTPIRKKSTEKHLPDAILQEELKELPVAKMNFPGVPYDHAEKTNGRETRKKPTKSSSKQLHRKVSSKRLRSSGGTGIATDDAQGENTTKSREASSNKGSMTFENSMILKKCRGKTKKKHVKVVMNQVADASTNELLQAGPKKPSEFEHHDLRNEKMDTKLLVYVDRVNERTDAGMEETLGAVSMKSKEIAEHPKQGMGCIEKGKLIESCEKCSGLYKRKHMKMSTYMSKDATRDETSHKGPQKPTEDKIQDLEDENAGTSSPLCRKLKCGTGQEIENENAKVGEKVKTKYKRISRKKISQTVNTPQIGGLKERSSSETQEKEADLELLELSGKKAGHGKPLYLGNETREKSNKANAQFGRSWKRDIRKVDNMDEDFTSVVVEDTPNSYGTDNKENQTISSPDKITEVLPAAKNPFPSKRKGVPTQIPCAFCHSCDVSEATEEMVHYFDGRPVAAHFNGGSHLVHSHKKCTEWAPNVYFEEDAAINLEAEISRSKRIKCNCCGITGAALGCYDKSCRKSFHVPCAKMTSQCRWDDDNFVMLCPLHSTSKLPKEMPEPRKQCRKKSNPKLETQTLVRSSWKWSSASAGKWLLCCSSLTSEEKELVSQFKKLAGISMAKTWNPAVTHVIASTDEKGACKRTLKFLMGILEGKWIVKIDWIKACLIALEPVEEEKYVVGVDIHGVTGGPQRGRLRVLNKEPKLFNGFKFYFIGNFTASYKHYLHDLVIAGGGTVLHRKPISRDEERLLNESSPSRTLIVYSLEVPDKCDLKKTSLIFDQRRAEAEALATVTEAKVEAHSWILNSIAACKIQSLD